MPHTQHLAISRDPVTLASIEALLLVVTAVSS